MLFCTAPALAGVDLRLPPNTFDKAELLARLETILKGDALAEVREAIDRCTDSKSLVAADCVARQIKAIRAAKPAAITP